MSDPVAVTIANTVLGPLTKPTYVIRMGFARWSRPAQHRWLLALREACLETIRRIDAELPAYQQEEGFDV